ncbi:SPX domain-containing protein 2 [Spatholobus suberectus]|nr:SPX domain-containing protein 2 [Spatholobus suberectus]
MKFRKILKRLIEQTLPGWGDKFLSYKNLKQQLKVMCLNDGHTPPQLDANELNHFLNLLHLEIDKFNTFFVDKEEEYVIKWKELQDRVAEAVDSNVGLMSLGREIVDFHGEMVLLENYSALNYTGLVKIIKKYDKKTGALLRSPFIQDVVSQPFFETDVLNKLVKECEVILSILFTNGPYSSMSEDFMENGFGSMSGSENDENVMEVPKELAEIENMENMYIKLTLSALHTLEEIRGRSSSVSMFSSPSPHN